MHKPNTSFKHLIIGHGYCGYYLARYLLDKNEWVTAVSRKMNPAYNRAGLFHLNHDIKDPFNWKEAGTILYYLIPPQDFGIRDQKLRLFLKQSQISIQKIVYFSSSAVYGDHKGAWIDEKAELKIENDRQKRRLDAETQWRDFSNANGIDHLILRIAGIYGPDRLPIEAAMQGKPLLEPQRAPFINYIYVKDLARIAATLAMNPHRTEIYNLADGSPQSMGSLQALTAKALKLPPTEFETFTEAWNHASPMKKELMQQSKRLSITKLKAALEPKFQFTEMEEAIRESLII